MDCRELGLWEIWGTRGGMDCREAGNGERRNGLWERCGMVGEGTDYGRGTGMWGEEMDCVIGGEWWKKK